jgi:16S rRNA (guanine966-N2)-methyltransferase
MRVIAGHLKGREFKSPHGHKTHPMSDKVKGALFNVLGDIEGLTILDAFAGSGALAFEAVSRGAKSVVAIDADSSAHSTLEQNVKYLKIGIQVKVVRANTGGWSIHNMEKKFDILLLDPPYDDLQENLLAKLIKRHVKPGGLAILSSPGKESPPKFDKTEIAAQKVYGDVQLVFYRKIS